MKINPKIYEIQKYTDSGIKAQPGIIKFKNLTRFNFIT